MKRISGLVSRKQYIYGVSLRWKGCTLPLKVPQDQSYRSFNNHSFSKQQASFPYIAFQFSLLLRLKGMQTALCNLEMICCSALECECYNLHSRDLTNLILVDMSVVSLSTTGRVASHDTDHLPCIQMVVVIVPFSKADGLQCGKAVRYIDPTSAVSVLADFGHEYGPGVLQDSRGDRRTGHMILLAGKYCFLAFKYVSPAGKSPVSQLGLLAKICNLYCHASAEMYMRSKVSYMINKVATRSCLNILNSKAAV